MMTKERFVKTINLIQNFQSEQNTLSVLIGKLTDGYGIVEFGDNLIFGIINMIDEDMKIAEDDDLLSWWLYEDVDKIVYETNDDGKKNKIEVKTPEQLYNYIIKEYNGDDK